MKVVLSWEEVLIGAVAGANRRILSTKDSNKRDTHDYKGCSACGGKWSMDIEGTLGEIAVAKVLGVYWSGQGGCRARDVLGYEVKASTFRSGGLLLHDEDEDDTRYMLITGELGSYEIRGWMLGKDAKTDPYRKRAMAILPRPVGAYLVPQEDLTPL